MPDGSERKPCHLVAGPGLTVEGDVTDGAPTVVIVWAWSAATDRPFALVVAEAELVPVPGRSDRWTVADPAHEGVVEIRYDRGSWCCGHPMKRWRPPGTGAARRSATA
jgi:hypothetical protein